MDSISNKHAAENGRPLCVQVGSLVAVCYTQEPSQLAKTNVAGFVWIQQVDTSDDSITFMCPHPTAPPSKCFVIGSIRRNLDLHQV